MNKIPGIRIIGTGLILACLSALPAAADQTADDYYKGTQQSPNRRYEAFTRVHQGEFGVKFVGLYVGDRRTKKTRLVYRNHGYLNAPVAAGWWPNGRRILFWAVEYGSSSANADGSTLYDISVRSGRRRHLGGGMRRPDYLAFSPDGRSLLLVDGWIRFAVTNKRIIRIDYRTGRHRTLTSRRMASIDPAWSPDGRQIAFASTPDDTQLGETDDIIHRWSRMHLWVMHANGSRKRQILRDPRYHEDSPRWIGASRIRFSRQENTEREWVSEWEIGSDGSGLRQIGSWHKPAPEE